ncbi:MAG: NAD(P)-dependent oxidoreductase [Candidatus Poribacteria bacterium]|nr:NAD(P)-dependent oxidoreductase [Candidatus Poribacteria bacterium]
MKKLLIIGAGHIGEGLSRYLSLAVPSTPLLLHELLHHTDDWKSKVLKGKPVLVVNAAGLTGEKKCESTGEIATMNANVDFAYDVMQAACRVGARCVQISTGAVYAPPSKTPKRESDALYAPNLYVESKIRMEHACCGSDTVIFRVSNVIGDGSHPNDYKNRIKGWSWVADTYVSTLSVSTFVEVLVRLMNNYENEPVSGIFNIADPGFKHLPSYARRFHETPVEMREVDALPARASLSHILDPTLAEMKGLLQ